MNQHFEAQKLSHDHTIIFNFKNNFHSSPYRTTKFWNSNFFGSIVSYNKEEESMS